MPFELHYSRVRLWRLVAIGVVMAAGALWLGLDSSISADGRFVARLTDMIGRDALQWGFLALSAISAATALLYLRLTLSGDGLAARAGASGLVLRTLFGTRRHSWPEVEGLFIRRVPTPGGEQLLVMVRASGRRDTGLAANALAEDADAEAWVVSAEQVRQAATASN